ncbi:MAG: cupin [Gimesia sp.]|uniref:Cupin domain-containing protein n=1 Tax=Gimesia benthica TaxID=2608982 RepID=A0A6I6AGL7_9PLAN|nr:cupin domain-containing protein [Gimesia benthica]MBN67909.1 cupin [Gimesia sp.]QGQ25784.1 cupin domain-containing protein [Gimesia benthica]
MAIPHAESGTIIKIDPLKQKLSETKTHTLAKTDKLEIIRLVMKKGKEISPHSSPGPITVQCLEGRVQFSTQGKDLDMVPGNLTFLNGGETHSVKAIEDSSLLLTLQIMKH